jgi:hypothetical protein
MPARRSCGEGGYFLMTGTRTLKRIALVLGIAALLFAQSVSAAERDWKSAGTSFNTDSNWTTSGGAATTAPGLGDVAWFKTAETVNPILNTSVSIAGLYFNGTGTSGYDITRSHLINV